MEAWSGSGSGQNMINETQFSCRTSELSTSNITNDSFWDLVESVKNGHIGIAAVESLYFLVGLVWNMFIIITYIYKRHLLKQAANIYLFVLAIVDALICAFLMPTAIVTAASNAFHFGNNDLVRCQICFMQGFFWVFSVMMSLNLLTVLSVDRCMVLSRPFTYKEKMVWWLALLLVGLCVAGAFITAIPPAFEFGEWEFNFRLGACIPRWTEDNNIFYVGFIIFFVMVSIVTIVVSNVFTFRIVYKFLRRGLRRRSTFRAKGREQYQDEQRTQRQQRQLVKVFIALMVANIVTWSPIILIFVSLAVITFVKEEAVRDIPPWIYTIGWIFFLSNPVIHPMLESFFIKELRYQVRRAKKTVRRSVRKASQTLIRAATTTFSDIPDMPEDSPNLNKPLQPNHAPAVLAMSLMTDVPDTLSQSSGSPNIPRSGSPIFNGKIPFSFSGGISGNSPTTPHEVRVHSPLEHSTVATSSPSPSPDLKETSNLPPDLKDPKDSGTSDKKGRDSPSTRDGGSPDLKDPKDPGTSDEKGKDSLSTRYGGRDSLIFGYGGRDSPITRYGGRDSPITRYVGRDSPVTRYGGRDSPITRCSRKSPSLSARSPTPEIKPSQSCFPKPSLSPRPKSPMTPTEKKSRHVSISLEDGTVFHPRSFSESATAKWSPRPLSGTNEEIISSASDEEDDAIA